MLNSKELRLIIAPALALLLLTILSLGISLSHPTVVRAQGSIIYVDTDATGAVTGLSWADAFTNVQDALTVANTNSGNTYEIWVAEGVYYPDEGAGHTADAEDEFFTLSYNNVQLYGGFAGDETVRTERDWAAHLTILSGDIDGNDTSVGGVVTDTANISGNNAYHVLYLDGKTNEVITESTVIDGFTITAGQADDGNHPHNYGGGLYCAGNNSGECSPTLTNVTFNSNSADYGGGMCNNGYSGTSSPALTNVTFSGNHAINGGGMYNYSDRGTSSPALTNVTFNGNSARSSGGGMYNYGKYGTSSPILTNVSFNSNYADWQGGGMYNYGKDGTSSPTLTNVTFSGNHAINGGGGMFNNGRTEFSSSAASNPTLINVILWGNDAESGDEMYNDHANPALSYTLVLTDSDNIYNSSSSVVTYGPGILHDDPLFVTPITATAAPTTTGDYRLQAGSPAIDAGDNSAVIGVATDLDGNPRIIGNTVDLGAYESTPLLSLSKNVTPTENAPYHGVFTYTMVISNTGSGNDTHAVFTDTLPSEVDFLSWIVQSGAAVSNDEITWRGTVTAGESITWTWAATHTGFGGVITNTAEFSGTTQTGTAEAVFAVEPPVLYVDTDATGSATGLGWTNAYTNVQDALNYTNAHGGNPYEIWVAEGVYYPDEGAGHTADAEDEYFTLRYNNVQLYGGFAGDEIVRTERDWTANVTVLSGDLAGDDATDSNGVVTDTANISGDNAYHVLWLDGETNEAITAATVIDGFTITAGQADGSNPHNYGGGMYCAGNNSGECSPTLTNVTFNSNSARKGSGIYNSGKSDGTSSPTLTNVTFNSNSAGSFGGGMYNDGSSGTSSPALTNVTFNSNSAGAFGGGMYNYSHSGGTSSPVLTNVTFNSNSADKGGGMYNDGYSGTSSPALTNVIFNSNHADTNGGGMYNDGYNGTSCPALTNVTFNSNHADNGGGMYNDGYSDGTSSPALTNVILWGNDAASGDEMYNYYATPALSYTLALTDSDNIYNEDSSVTYGPGILHNDPLFVTPITATAAPTTTGDYRLQAGSPAIDAGDNNAVIGVATDLDGNPRIIGNTVDLGAYESTPLLSLSKSVTPTENVPYHGVVTYTVVLRNNGEVDDANTVFTDTLPDEVDFGGWITQAGAAVSNDEITWSGIVTAHTAITWTWAATHTGVGNEIVTNTAEFSGSLQTATATVTISVTGTPDDFYIYLPLCIKFRR